MSCTESCCGCVPFFLKTQQHDIFSLVLGIWCGSVNMPLECNHALMKLKIKINQTQVYSSKWGSTHSWYSNLYKNQCLITANICSWVSGERSQFSAPTLLLLQISIIARGCQKDKQLGRANLGWPNTGIIWQLESVGMMPKILLIVVQAHTWLLVGLHV